MSGNKMKASNKVDLLKNIVDSLHLNNLPDSSQFYAEDDLNIEDIKIEIDNVGELSFPLSESFIEKFINISSKAPFGAREKTLLDEKIRDTYQISPDKLHVTLNQQVLNHLMNKFRKELGLDDKCTLSLFLHNMLIYKVGQFFDLHQDSEKMENMVGTLVIVLPNAHIGGDLIIEYGERKHIFSSEALNPIKAKCIAFYSDCLHKVEQVKDGNRIALTYNLVLKTIDSVMPSLIVNEELCKAILEYFNLKEDEQMLVYFLNHSYTEHGLQWNLLKGEDRTNGRILFAAAQQLGLIPHLSLVQIRENWAASEYDQKDDLIEDEVTLSFWIDSDNKKVPFSDHDISKDDVCFTKDTEAFEPYNKEYEGFTGNEGRTMDYWYRRAAIVLWPECNKYAMNFKLAYDYALRELSELCRSPGNKEKVMEIIMQAEKYLCKIFSRDRFNYEEPTGDVKNRILKLSIVALYIESSEIALMLFSNSDWRTLSSDFAEHLSNLQLKYDISWCIDLLNKMRKISKYTNLDNFNLLIRSLVEHKVDDSIINLILDVQFDVVSNCITQKRTSFHYDFQSEVSTRIEKLKEYLTACLVSKSYSWILKMIKIVLSNTDQFTLTSLAEMYVELCEPAQPEERIHFVELKNYVTKRVDHKVISGKQSNDDWSVNDLLPCMCVKCVTANRFLLSKTEKTFLLKLPAKLRSHVMMHLINSKIPVHITTQSNGLLLVKTDALHRETSRNMDELKLCQEKLRILND